MEVLNIQYIGSEFADTKSVSESAEVDGFPPLPIYHSIKWIFPLRFQFARY